MKTINVTTKTKSYAIKIGTGALSQLGDLVKTVWQPSQVAVVTDTNVHPHYAQPVVTALKAAGFQVHVLTVPWVT